MADQYGFAQGGYNALLAISSGNFFITETATIGKVNMISHTIQLVVLFGKIHWGTFHEVWNSKFHTLSLFIFTNNLLDLEQDYHDLDIIHHDMTLTYILTVL